ncbi:MAG: TrkA family potassium uptake protein [Coriobacteriales bacterium]|jgi:Trk K+ transport system NAD-binding subunit|nr:TrkA family potassium uptake protein [Coriobacteriales bacterium]
MNIIIVGCGRVGSQLAQLLSHENNSVTVIDSSSRSFANLGRNFDGRTVVGVGFDEDTLMAAGINECDVLAAVTDQDNSNLMIAEVGRKLFDVPHVLTRLYNPDRKSAYLQLGLDYVCGTELVAEEMYSKIVAEHGGHIDTFGDYEILSFALALQEETHFSDYVEKYPAATAQESSSGATCVQPGVVSSKEEVPFASVAHHKNAANSEPAAHPGALMQSAHPGALMQATHPVNTELSMQSAHPVNTELSMQAAPPESSVLQASPEAFGRQTHYAPPEAFGRQAQEALLAHNEHETRTKAILVGAMERDHEIRIIAFERKDGSLNSLPTKDSVLYEGDIVLACVHKDKLAQFAHFMSR